MNVNPVTGADGTLVANNVENSSNARSTGFSDLLDQTSLSYGDYLEQIFQKAADTYQVSKDLLKAMAKAESNFNANATSRCGAMGIMQLMPATARSLGVTDAYDPEQNIMGGAKYISSLLERYNGNLSYAVAAYNAGGGNVDKYGGIPPFTETQNYVTKVLKYLEEGVVIPDSSGTVSTGSGLSAGASSSGSTLQGIFDKYFDYDDYLEFLQLFTKVIYEKLTGTELSQKLMDAENEEKEKEDAQEVQQAGQQKRLTMTVRDSNGRINTYQQDTSDSSDAYTAFQSMTSGGHNRLSIVLNRTSE